MRELSVATLYVCLLIVPLLPAEASAEIRRVGAGEDLQAVLNAAQPGDVILLAPGARFTGNFVLPVKAGAEFITIRTEPSGTNLPVAGNRIQPSHAPWLAKLRSPNVLSALRTERRAHHWRLELLEFEANRDGSNDIIRIGDAAQTDVAEVPYAIEIDRCYIHGDPLLGQKRGVTLLSGETSITNSYISDIKGVGMDTQAIGGWNGPGPYTITNNYLEGAGENVMFGGSDPTIVDLVPSDIVFRGNHVRKPVQWRDPLVTNPATVAGTIVPGAGTLPAGTYVYRVTARRPAGQSVMATSTPSAELTIGLAAPAAVQLSWAASAHATEYRVYRRPATGTQWEFWTSASNSFVDAGAPGAVGTPPSYATTWTIKNLFELKSARRVLIEGNVFENNWLSAQTGSAILLKSWNQDGRAPWSVVEDVVFTRNIVRHVSTAFNVLGYGATHPTQQLRNLSITHNLVYDVDSRVWGGDGRFLMIGDSPANVTVDHNTVVHTATTVAVHGKLADGTRWPIQGFTYTNNLALHNEYGFKGDGTGVGNATIAAYFPGAHVAANVLAGGNPLLYPAGNFFPPASSYLAEFDADYRLRSGSAYKLAATDGTDLGADIDALLAAVSATETGNRHVNEAPVASTAGPYTGPTLALVAFDGSASYDPDGSIASYSWNWGDGCPNTSGATSSHQYTRGSTYTVTLTVTDDKGIESTATTAATIWNRAPSALAGGPYTAEAGQPMTVDGSAASDPDGAVVQYRWSWGDGSPDSIGAASAFHVYAAVGDYTLVLTVTDDQGATSSAITTASITEAGTRAEAAPEIVIYTGELPSGALHGNWALAYDDTAAGGAKLASTDLGWATTAVPLANPKDYFEATFDARADVEYRVWFRMTASGNSKWNDSLWVQFSGAVDATGSPLYRLGTMGALLVNLAPSSAATELNGWGWQNGAYWLRQGTSVRFAAAGAQTIRIQTREDGVQIDQIVLSPLEYFDGAPGEMVGGDAAIVSKPLTDIVLHASDMAAFTGAWQQVLDVSAAGGRRLSTADAGWTTTSVPFASPAHYVDVTFTAQANLDYRVWLRMKAQNNNKYNDAVWVQFSDAWAGGVPIHQIGTTKGLIVNLATSSAAVSLNGWGWQTGAYWLSNAQQPSVIRFPTTGRHTMRIQVREDGVSFDQVVFSPERFMLDAPGAVTADSTILEK